MNKKQSEDKYKNKYKTDSIRLKNWDYSAKGFYFITIAVKNRENILGNIDNEKMILNEYGYIVKQFWEDLINHYDNIKLDAFVVMPNHFHGIIIIDTPAENTVENTAETIHELSQRQGSLRKQRRQMLIPKIIGRFKMNTSKAINIERNTQGHRFWQRNYYDRIIRTEKELENVRNYIKNNPVNWKKDKHNK